MPRCPRASSPLTPALVTAITCLFVTFIFLRADFGQFDSSSFIDPSTLSAVRQQIIDSPLRQFGFQNQLCHPRHRNMPTEYAIYEYLPLTPPNKTTIDDFLQLEKIRNEIDATSLNFALAASECVQKEHFDPKAYLTLNETYVRIVWAVRLHSSGTARKTVLGQLEHLTSPTGLFRRPKTMLHIVVVSDSMTELRWFYNLPLLSDPSLPISIFETTDDALDFWASRWLWQLSCSFSNDIFVYFRSFVNPIEQQSADRNLQEIVLSRQLLLPWRSFMSILASTSQPTLSLWGGSQVTWLNFFWVRGNYVRNLLQPIRTIDPNWYERWSGMRVDTSQCDRSDNMERASREPVLETDLDNFLTRNRSATPRWHWYPDAFYGVAQCKGSEGSRKDVEDSFRSTSW